MVVSKRASWSGRPVADLWWQRQRRAEGCWAFLEGGQWWRHEATNCMGCRPSPRDAQERF